MYKQFKNSLNEIVNNAIIRTSDNAIIPFDQANTDYQAFLLWKSEGNTPLPADEVA